MSSNTHTSLTYRDAGVDIDAGDELVERIKPFAKKTMRPEVLGRHRRLRRAGRGLEEVQEPGDGLGHRRRGHQAEARLPPEEARHDRHRPRGDERERHPRAPAPSRSSSSTTSRAASSNVDVAADVVKGVADGLRAGGLRADRRRDRRDARHVRPQRIRPRGLRRGPGREATGSSTARRIAAGDAVIGLASSGPHSNGYSLIRKIVATKRRRLRRDVRRQAHARRRAARAHAHLREAGARDRIAKATVKGIAHITGGGLTGEHPARAARERLRAPRPQARWKRPAIFDWLQRHGPRRRRRDDAHVQLRHRHGDRGRRRPRPTRRSTALAAHGVAALRGRRDRRARSRAGRRRSSSEVRRVILISGRGSNMQALVEGGTGTGVPRGDLQPPRREGARLGARRRALDTRGRRPQGVRARARRSTPRSATRSRAHRARPGAARGLHAHPQRRRSSQRFRAAHRQHPSVAAARVSRAAHAPAGARGGREDPRRAPCTS